MSEEIVDKKTEFTPNGVSVTWRAVKSRDCGFSVEVFPEGDFIKVIDSNGDRIELEKEYAAHIGRALIALSGETPGSQTNE